LVRRRLERGREERKKGKVDADTTPSPVFLHSLGQGKREKGEVVSRGPHSSRSFFIPKGWSFESEKKKKKREKKKKARSGQSREHLPLPIFPAERR